MGREKERERDETSMTKGMKMTEKENQKAHVGVWRKTCREKRRNSDR